MKKVLLSLCCFLLAASAVAQNFERLSEKEENLFGKKVYVSGDYESMKAIRRFWVQESIRLKNHNYEFVHCGANEGVLKVTIPSRLLFQQGDTILSTTADGFLRPFLRLLRGNEAMATLVVTCYSDNNGSDKYLKGMTNSRARAVAKWMYRQGVDHKGVSVYGMGNEVPKTDNSTLAKRERNRRVSLYLVPNRNMMKQAKRGRLNK